MCKNKTIDKFINESKDIHGDKYDYSKFVYVNNKTKGEILCKKCGTLFKMSPANHICEKQGCPTCNGTRKYTTEEWINKAKEKHGNKYDYSKSKYLNSETKIEIICHEKDEFGNEHGSFFKLPKKHINGQGCPKCSKMHHIPFEIFVQRARKKHGDKYNYHENEYTNYNSETLITCPIHGDYKQLPYLHVNGHGCIQCADVERRKKRSIPFNEFIKRAKKAHGDLYDYNEDSYKNYTTKTEIICKKHGSFMQMPYKHVEMKQGCPKCKMEHQTERQLLTLDEFKKRSLNIHGDKYDYSKVTYKGNNKEVEIICPEHGTFWQKPLKHWIGQGCPKCNQSHLERDVELMLKNEGIDFIYQATKKDLNFLDMKSIDFYIPSLKIAIECQGIQHFEDMKFMKSDKAKESDVIKYNICEKNNVNLIYYTNHIDKAEKMNFYNNKIIFNDINNLRKFIKSYETSN